MNIRSIIGFAVGPIFSMGLGLIYLPILTWFFSIEDIGRLSLLQVVTSLSTLLFCLGLDQSYVREYHEIKNKSHLFKHTFLPGLLGLLGIIIFVILNDISSSELIFEVQDNRLNHLVLICILCTFVSRFFSLILRMKERGLLFSIGLLLPKITLLTVLFIYFVSETKLDLFALILAHSIALLLTCLYFSWHNKRELLEVFSKTIDMVLLKRLFKFGMPLVLGGMAFWGLTAIDKIFLKNLSSFNQLGIYSVAVSFAALGSVLQSIFSTIWAPTVYKLNAEKLDPDFLNQTCRYTICIVILVFSLVGLLSWIIPLFLPDEYQNIQYIVCACLGYPLLYSLSEVTVVGIGIARKSHLSMLATVIACFVNILGNYLLIPHFGAAGAAASTCFSFFVMFILRTEFAIYCWEPLPRKTLYPYTICAVIGAILSSIFAHEITNYLIIFWSILLVVTLLKFINEIKDGIAFAKNLINLK